MITECAFLIRRVANTSHGINNRQQEPMSGDYHLGLLSCTPMQGQGNHKFNVAQLVVT